ncbi:MAG: class I tRNA ligase family protein, partial [Patescibacteria group bacterium]
MLKGLKKFNLPEVEEKVLEFWKENDIFKKSLAKNQPSPRLRPAKEFIFYEGPPTANGRPGMHHILTRTFKDIILRYKTMRGFFVPRKAGWDTQGLPIEIEIEKELGLKSKKEIEEYGIAEFNEKAKSSVWKYKDEWEKLTERVGLWLDFENAYITYSNEYLEKLWSVFKKIDKRKLLVKGHKVVPWCPRCGTALSSHELAQGYKEVTDNSVYIKFKIKNPKSNIQNLFILSWTTTPWTLPGNVALAVGKNIDYQKIKVGEEFFLIAKDRAREVLGENLVFEEIIKGKDLIGLEYEPLFEVKKIKSDKSYKIYDADFVTTTDGTGVVHTAVMYGEDDYNLGKELGLPQYHTVDKQGRFNNDVPVVGGLKVKEKETEERIFNHLKEKNYLLKIEPYKHEYPFCWRCGTHILYYANDSWFILMSKLRKELIAANEKVNWIPEYLKEGRFGEWLREVKDWAISRERYWGTPLPIWECAKCDEKLVVGSLEELNKFDYHKNKYWIGRHGESTSNTDGWISGDKETDKKSELTENGVKQIEEAAKKIQNKGIDIIYSSPFLRTKQTAAIYKKVLKAEVIYDKRLAELNGGMFNGKPTEDFVNFFDHPVERFTKRPLNGEHASDVKKRMMNFIKEINRQYVGKNILIISHGDPLWILVSALKGLSNETALTQEDDHYLSTGTVKELKFNNWPFNREGELDLHRPYIDEIDLACPKCKNLAKRVKEVADVWFDSGAMPFATGEYPDRYPADYICEAIDQTRGWFYTLLAVGVLMGEDSPYKNVISLGHLLDKNGQKMSKSKGNVVNPWDLINKYGVDVVRWYFYTVNPPAESKKFDEADLGKTYRRFVALLYNSYLFLETYSGGKIDSHFKNFENLLDRWIISRLHQTIETVTKKLDKYDIGGAAKEIEFLVDGLSHWYIRRSRKRPEALPV